MNRIFAIAITIIAVIVVATLWAATQRRNTVPTSAFPIVTPNATERALIHRSLDIPPKATGFDTDAYPDAPITTASVAEGLSLAQLPEGIEPTATVIKLLSRSTYEQQFHSLTENGFDASLGPVWLVGFLASGLTGESLDPPPILSTPAAPAVPGFYFAWDANSASPDAMGPLRSTGPKSMSGISQLPDETPPIVMATPVP